MKHSSHSSLLSSSFDGTLEVGDVFELGLVEGADILRSGLLRLDVTLASLFSQHNAEIFVASASGARAPVICEADMSALRLEREGLQILGVATDDTSKRYLVECVSTVPACFALKAESERFPDTPERETPSAETVAPISFSRDDIDLLRLESRLQSSFALFNAGALATQLQMVAGFEDLLSLALVRDMQPLEHQINTVKTALRRFRGRAMFCDEVGLGKTIEAGMTILELTARGLARRALILTPPSLTAQWQGEMKQKFGMEFLLFDTVTYKEQGIEPLLTAERIILSYHTAKREPYRSAILQQEWDVVAIDEAHHLRNRTTLLWKFASELKKKYIFLLTATPVQNNLEELFNLVTLLQPGLLSTANAFQKQFVDKTDKLKPRNVDKLHALLSEAMIRNSRATVGIAMTRRIARTESVSLTPEERELYDEASKFILEELRAKAAAKEAKLAEQEVAKAARAAKKAVKESDAAKKTDDKKSAEEKHPSKKTKQSAPQKKTAAAENDAEEETGKGLSKIGLLTLQRELGSSPQAAAGTLRRMAEDKKLAAAARKRLLALAEKAQNLRTNAKAERLLALARDFPDRMVVFTQFRDTQTMLFERLSEAGERVVMFHGGMLRLQKEAAIQQFRSGEARILLSTDSGSEGRNLQFCNAICNFDLPWNPMKIEQRIGRLSRIGQERDVFVFNFAAADTFESAVLHLLEAKIAMFELVVGEIDMILGNVDEDQEFEETLTELWVESDTLDDFNRKLDRLGDKLLAAKEAYLKQKELENQLFGDKFGAE